MTLVLSAVLPLSELEYGARSSQSRARHGAPGAHGVSGIVGGSRGTRRPLHRRAGAVDAAPCGQAALHVALATLAGVDTLASWNFKHLLNFYRLRRFHCVNRELGHPHLEIHEAQAVLGENIVDPNKKGFDCVAFQREQRERISRKLNTMTKEEQLDYLRNVEITDPILRRVMERARWGRANDAAVEPKVPAEQFEE